MTTIFARAAIAVLIAASPSASLAATRSTDADLAPCQHLGAVARSLPAVVWSAGFKALAPQLVLADPNAKLTAQEQRLAALPAVKTALADEDGGYQIFVQQIAPNLFVASDTQGTLECQSFVFLKLGRSGAASIAPEPPSFSERCWTDSGAAGRVFGQPAFVETSDFDDPAADEQHLEITPWTGGGWGLPCRLTLHYRIAFTLTERFCGDRDVCAAAAPLATRIARAHGTAKPDTPFAYGPEPSEADMALLARFTGQPQAFAAPEFPTFGAKAKTAFDAYSYNDVDLFPLKLSRTTYVAAIGYGGVGWREIGDSLLAIYAPDGESLKPLAGFVVVKSVTGLASAKVDRPKPDTGR